MDQYLYMHFGKIPSDGKSKVYYNSGDFVIAELAGVSCYRCLCRDGKYSLVMHEKTPSYVFRELFWTYQETGLDVYILKGTVVGTGPDGEPLLSDIEIVDHLKIEDITSYGVDWKDYNLYGMTEKFLYVKLYDSKWKRTTQEYFDNFKGKKIETEREHPLNVLDRFYEKKGD